MRSLAQMRQDSREIFDAGLAAADPQLAIRRHVNVRNDTLSVAGKIYDLSLYRRIFLVGAGKASARMAHALEDILGDRVTGGIVNVKYDHAVGLRAAKVNEAGHPVPDEAGQIGAREIIDLAREAEEQDLIFCLISGGGSALLPCPADGLSLGDKQQTTQVLLACGATIHEINAIRKHISKVKGGRLARWAFPATVISLILSDVIGDSLDSIASGPTTPDSSTFADCLKIVRRYGIEGKIPPSVFEFLNRGARGEVEDTPKPGDPTFHKVQNVITGSNRLALEAAQRKAEELGYNSLLLSSFIEGETKVVAAVHGAIAKEIIATGNPVAAPACVISGGETTVTIHGSGLGGRNQEFVLAAARDIAALGNVVILSGGTDGSDGPTNAAGALADGRTVERAMELGLDPEAFLQNNDSYHFFQPLEDLLITGPTFTNVMDLRIILAA
ncbi:MAG: glycerate kinase [Deltaproteobacteria bacterium]|nr:glycerate kinase [Deltaproteobacteria bacterium]